MKRTILLICAALLLTAFLPQGKPIKQIDATSWYWQKDTTLVIMKVVFTKTDTIANYHYYAHIKTTRVHHFNLKRFLDSQK